VGFSNPGLAACAICFVRAHPVTSKEDFLRNVMATVRRAFEETLKPAATKKAGFDNSVPAPLHGGEDLSELASPVPSSVCPTESSAASTALGETVEIFFSDGESCSEDDDEAACSDVECGDELEAGFDSDVAKKEHLAWVEVGSRLSRAFQAAADSDSSEEDIQERLASRWEPQCVAADGFAPQPRQTGFPGVLGSRTGRLELLEHYGCFGAPSGSWRRGLSSASSASGELHEDSSEEDGRPESPEGFERGTEEWQNVGNMFVRAFKTPE